MQERHNGEQEEARPKVAQESFEQESEETLEAHFERIVERGAAIVEEIAQYAEASGEDADFEKRRKGAVEVLGEEEVVAIEDEAQVHERLELVNEQKRALAGNTLEKVRALADLLLSDELNDDEREELYERLGLEKLGSGAYFDAYDIPGSGYVFKPLKLNYLHSREDAVRILAAQTEEERLLREHFGGMIPETLFVYPDEYEEVFAEEKARAEQGQFRYYGVSKFLRMSLEKRMDPSFTPHDIQGLERQGAFDRTMEGVGAFLKEKTPFYRQEAAGAVIQERIHGISFEEFFSKYPDPQSCPNAEKLQESVRQFVGAFRSFNEESAFCLLGFGTDNALIEVDPETGEPTGDIKVPDINYTQRVSERVRQRVNEKSEGQILEPLEEKFGLRPVEEGATTTQGTE